MKPGSSRFYEFLSFGLIQWQWGRGEGFPWFDWFSNVIGITEHQSVTDFLREWWDDGLHELKCGSIMFECHAKLAASWHSNEKKKPRIAPGLWFETNQITCGGGRSAGSPSTCVRDDLY